MKSKIKRNTSRSFSPSVDCKQALVFGFYTQALVSFLAFCFGMRACLRTMLCGGLETNGPACIIYTVSCRLAACAPGPNMRAYLQASSRTVRDFMSLSTGARVNIILKFSVHTFPSIQLPCRSTGWQPRDSSHKGHIM